MKGIGTRVAWESTVLALICTADMIYTLWLVASGAATEANPIMGFYFEHSQNAFVGAKTLLIVGSICALEILRRKRPRTVQPIIRMGLVLYVVFYGIGLWYANSPAKHVQPAHFLATYR